MWKWCTKPCTKLSIVLFIFYTMAKNYQFLPKKYKIFLLDISAFLIIKNLIQILKTFINLHTSFSPILTKRTVIDYLYWIIYWIHKPDASFKHNQYKIFLPDET